jgi:hypothetical protein
MGARQYQPPSTPPDADDYDEGGLGGEVCETVVLGEDTTHEARAVARSQARAAVHTIVGVMRRPGRGAMSQLGAASKLLELAGVGPAEAEQRVLAQLLELAKATLAPGPYAELVHAVARASGRDVATQRAELPGGSGVDESEEP